MRRLALALGDIALLYFALILTLLIRYEASFGEQYSIHFVPFTIIFGLWLLIFYIFNIYEISHAKNNVEFYSLLIYSVAVFAVISVLFFYLIPYFGITPKRNLFIFIGFSLILIVGWRWVFNKLMTVGGYRSNTLIIGNNPQSQDMYDFLLHNPQLGYNALGIIDVKDPAAVNILESVIRQKRVKNLILAPEAYQMPEIVKILYHLLDLQINFSSLSVFYERTTGKIPLGAIDQVWFINNLSEGTKRGYEIVKRTVDVFASSIFGIASLLIYPLVLLATKIDDGGPLFYTQKRIGQAGSIFRIVKFRTMSVDAEAMGAQWAQRNDPRVTRVGKFLRRTRIDELPQLWNVLLGTMSFVGPRPERPEFHSDLKDGIPFYDERYLIKPGLTGWAQIKYRYGSTVQDAAEKLQYDLFYVKNRSIALDIGILLKTLSIVLRQAGR